MVTTETSSQLILTVGFWWRFTNAMRSKKGVFIDEWADECVNSSIWGAIGELGSTAWHEI